MDKPIVSISMGDPAGIGPEITVKALLQPSVYDKCRPMVVGDAKVMADAVRFLDARVDGKPVAVRPVGSVAEARFEPGVIDVYDLDNVDMAQLEYGVVKAMCGHAAFEAVRTNIELAMAGQVDATVTAPINKEAIHAAGHDFSGHTEIYAHYTGTKNYAMLLADESLRVIHVSTHVSLREACDRAKKARVLDCIGLLHNACRQFGIDKPHLAVAGLNPHSGENGLFGREEIEEIIPAIEQARAQGFDVEGPVPPDTVFAKAVQGKFDGVVAMYHDQGHVPFKLVGFKWNNEKQKMDSVKGVNITLGLPIIRTSVDHGTAFEIAGRGIACEDAMLISIDYALKMAQNR